MSISFRKESIKKISSPEELNDYIKVSSTGIWAVLATVVVLLVSFGVWAIFGSMTSVVNMNGFSDNKTVTCYIANASELKKGDEVTLSDGSKGVITDISATPVSKQEVESGYDDFTAYSLQLSDWNYVVHVASEQCGDGIVSAQIIVENIKPISFIWH